MDANHARCQLQTLGLSSQNVFSSYLTLLTREITIVFSSGEIIKNCDIKCVMGEGITS